MGEAKRRKTLGIYPTTPRIEQASQGVANTETVYWDVLGDLESHPMSQEVIQILEDLRQEYSGYGGNTMLVTLESAVGKPLIRARVQGLGAFMGLINRMQRLGLHDRLEQASGPERGIDAAFM